LTALELMSMPKRGSGPRPKSLSSIPMYTVR